ncbi:Fic family protein [Leifsonia sp. Leaf264]|uniref:Fic family protein n=1 Tax=Leifsonia sp. Leaf264 TaxID=1736314 RepID=UPI0006F907C3|nr:Fic family protein [Leifsonia sp. Leaf264]KQO98452.1 hypothetical protein ASF30_10345 [Leifsonia sp. Leaf264]
MAIIFSEDLPSSRAGTDAVSQGKLRRIAQGIYTDDMRRPLDEVVAENWQRIVGHELPGAVITDRSAFTGKPVDGHLFVAHTRARTLELPGLTIVPASGPAAQPDDIPVSGGLYLASEHRGFIDNAKPSRAVRGRPPRTLTREEIHTRIAELTPTRTKEQWARFQKNAEGYAAASAQPEGLADISAALGAATGDRPSVDSPSTLMNALKTGRPYDHARVKLFQKFADDLKQQPPRPRTPTANQEYLPFFDAYFSNFIEGTEFGVEEAAKIAIDGQIPVDRPEDAHDVAGTYRIVNDPAEMALTLTTFADFEDAMKRRHAAIMEGRPGRRPGEYKLLSNRAGDTEFVHPDQVLETLKAGWEIGAELAEPFTRAAYSLFLISEVHPFVDGNGRAARIMMNAELVRAGQQRIIIPINLRNEYLSGLVRLTNYGNSDGLVQVMDFAQRYAGQIDFTDFDTAWRELRGTNAFLREGPGLRLPAQMPAGWSYADLDSADMSTPSLIDSIINVELADDGTGRHDYRAGQAGQLTDRGRYHERPAHLPEQQL